MPSPVIHLLDIDIDEDSDVKVFSQQELSKLMMRHRKLLQQRVLDQVTMIDERDAQIRELRKQLATQMTIEINPVAKVILSALGLVRGANTYA